MSRFGRIAQSIILFLAFAVITRVPSFGQTANRAVELPQAWDSSSKIVTVPAPNGRLILKVSGKRTGKSYPDEEWVPDYYLEQNGHRLRPDIKAFSMPSALWSPDSTMLAITSSDGGLVGNWKAFVYTVEDGHVIKHDVMRQTQADLALKFPGGVNPTGKHFFTEAERRDFARDTTWVNVLAVQWLSNPDRLLVTASVPPSSSYGPNLGKLRGYVIDPLTGAIIRSYSEAELGKRYHYK